MYLNVSEDQSVNGGLMLTTSCASGAFRLGKWIFKLSKKIPGFTSPEGNTLLTNALSAYRGGYCDGDSSELKELIHDLAGTQDARLDGNFIFLGNKSDLSYFWKLTNKDNSTIMLRSYIDTIPDEKLKANVISTMTRAQLDGIVAFDGKSYALTSKGRKAIFNTDFALGRLKNECQHLGIAKNALDAQYDNVQNDRIDKRLSELGLDGKFDNCDRVTANKAKLLARDNGSNMSFFVPGTSRMTTVDIPSDHVIELDDKTYALFLERGKDISATLGGKNTVLSEQEVFKAFENKNKGATPDQISSAIDKAEREADASSTLGEFETDDFFETALNRSYAKGEIGNNYTVFLPNGEEAQYTVTSTWADIDGSYHFNLKSTNGEHGDLLLPQDAINTVAFKDADQGRAFVEAHPDITQEYDRFFSLQGENAETVKELSYKIKQGSFTKTEDGYSISAKGNKHVNVNIPDSNARLSENGELLVTMNKGNTYTVSTGSYQTTVTAEGAGKMLGKSAEAVKASEAAAKAVKTSTEVTVKTGAAAVSATLETASAITPPVEAVTAVAKTVMKAASTAVSATSQTISVSNQFSQKL